MLLLTDYPVLFPLDRKQTRFRVSSHFGSRIHPVKGKRSFHRGVDLAASCGEPVFSSGNGTVITAGYSGSYGWFVRIRHAGGYATLYAHLSRLHVRKGMRVRIGQHIGDVGNTGVSTGCHLHFELEKNRKPMDPIGWFYR